MGFSRRWQVAVWIGAWSCLATMGQSCSLDEHGEVPVTPSGDASIGGHSNTGGMAGGAHGGAGGAALGGHAGVSGTGGKGGAGFGGNAGQGGSAGAGASGGSGGQTGGSGGAAGIAGTAGVAAGGSGQGGSSGAGAEGGAGGAGGGTGGAGGGMGGAGGATGGSGGSTGGAGGAIGGAGGATGGTGGATGGTGGATGGTGGATGGTGGATGGTGGATGGTGGATGGTGGAGGSVGPCSASLQVAGALLVCLDADQASAGKNNWQNLGTIGGSFKSVGGPTQGVFLQVSAIQFSGNDGYEGPDSIAEIEGNSDRSIEVWVANQSLQDEEAMVSWSQRDGAVGTMMSFNYGNNQSWGAATHWGWQYHDLGWGTQPPMPNHWHYLVYTFSGNTARVYSDTVLANSRTPLTLNTTAGHSINLAFQRTNNSFDRFGSLWIARVRVHSGALQLSQIQANYVLESSHFNP